VLPAFSASLIDYSSAVTSLFFFRRVKIAGPKSRTGEKADQDCERKCD
jgi:hypothetical protein